MNRAAVRITRSTQRPDFGARIVSVPLPVRGNMGPTVLLPLSAFLISHRRCIHKDGKDVGLLLHTRHGFTREVMKHLSLTGGEVPRFLFENL